MGIARHGTSNPALLAPLGRPVHGATAPGGAAACRRTSALSAAEVDEVAAMIATARMERRSAVLPQHLRTRSWTSVVEVLLEVERQLPWAPAGWKVGAASEEVRKAEGIPTPTPGRLYRDTTFVSPATLAPEVFINYRNCECEFAYRIGMDLPPRDRPYTEADAAAAVDCLLPAIEIGDLVFDDWYDASSYYGACIDNGGGGAIVVGQECRDWRTLDLTNASIDVWFNDTYLKSGQGRAAMGAPLTSLTWMINWLRERGRSIVAGELISTGTCTGHCFAQEGDAVRADFGPLGTVEVTFAGLPKAGGPDADQ